MGETVKYRAGDVEKILGISGETLRFFEKKGLVKPERDLTNNYRYFDTLDLNKMVAYKLYRSFEFSMEEAIEMVRIGNDAQIERLSEQAHNIEAKARHYADLADCIRNFKSNYKQLTALLDAPELTYCDAAILYYNQLNDAFEMCDTSRKATEMWLDCLPYVKIAIHVELSESGEVGNMHFGYGVESHYSKVFRKLAPYTKKSYPQQLCVHGLIRYTDAELTRADFDPPF